MEKNFIHRLFLFLFVVFLGFNFLTLGGGTFCFAASLPTAPGSDLASSIQQVEESLEEILSGPSFFEKAANFLYTIYDYIKKAIIFLLGKTIFKENPKLADFYGDVASFLASLTAIYLILLLVSSAKKIIGVILILGWALFTAAILLRG